MFCRRATFSASIPCGFTDGIDGAGFVEPLDEGAAGSSNFGFQFGFASKPAGAFSGKKFIGGGSTGVGVGP